MAENSSVDDIATLRRRSELSEDVRRRVVKTLAAFTARLQSSHIFDFKVQARIRASQYIVTLSTH